MFLLGDDLVDAAEALEVITVIEQHLFLRVVFLHGFLVSFICEWSFYLSVRNKLVSFNAKILAIVGTHGTHKRQRLVETHLGILSRKFNTCLVLSFDLPCHIQVGETVLLFNGHILLIQHNIVQQHFRERLLVHLSLLMN